MSLIYLNVSYSPFILLIMSSALGLIEKRSKPSTFIMQQKENLQKKVEELLGTDGVFLYPSHTRAAPRHHHPLFRPYDFAYTGKSIIWCNSMQRCRFSANSSKIQAFSTLLNCWTTFIVFRKRVNILNHFTNFPGILNILGLPVTQCPLGVGEERLPLGVQVVAGKLQDHLSLEVALYLEKTFGGWRDPGGVLD